MALSVTGCATVKSWFVEEKQEQQITQVVVGRLALPDGFSNPKKSNEFEIEPGTVAQKDHYM